MHRVDGDCGDGHDGRNLDDGDRGGWERCGWDGRGEGGWGGRSGSGAKWQVSTSHGGAAFLCLRCAVVV
ncbi:hypothetical protein GCM10018962_49190 [Dactylosporangium matsuzakiense]|uniref:Uncharacterized protein n=1 Tax=Dactylosporangium matsuzakiense TaxID=53360 RepID=A0A9W6KUA6_9ACTN|nr:hypothetical protein GCM10017581_091090 [Dactylosporangium matsuzakiense]